jgi:vacuolar iron transporter family protein
MRQSIKTGISFGLTSGIITTIGLMVGLYSGTKSELAVIGGILTIAVADAMSDALGIHISEESDKNNSGKHIIYATFATFFAKFLFALTFLIPFLFFEMKNAIIFGMIYGLIVLSLLSYNVAKRRNENKLYVIFEHLSIAVIVIFVTYYLGKLINYLFV